MAKKKETDYRSGSALLKKQLAERAGKPVGLPSKKNVVNAVKQIGGAAITIAGPGKVVKGVQAAAKVAKTAKAAKQSTKRVEIMNKVEKKADALKAARTVAKKPSPSVKVVKPQGNASAKFRNEKEADRIARTARTKTASSKDLRGRAKQDYEVSKIKVSDNVTARVPAKSNYEFAKDMSTFGKIQKQNAAPLQATKADAAANARALKAAQGKSLASPSKKAVSKQNAEGRAKLNSLRNRFKK
jgi:hypothetical protein